MAEEVTRRRVRAFERRIDGRREKRRAIGAPAEREGEGWWGRGGGGFRGGLPPPVGETSPTRTSGASKDREGQWGGSPVNWRRGIGPPFAGGRPSRFPDPRQGAISGHPPSRIRGRGGETRGRPFGTAKDEDGSAHRRPCPFWWKGRQG